VVKISAESNKQTKRIPVKLKIRGVKGKINV
jgi:hypothetical protein